jgi:signal transduction histidine kinase
MWSPETVPELAEMTRRCNQALEQNLPAYEQEYHYIGNGAPIWLHEHVSIRRVSDTVWELTGVITDITEKHQAVERLSVEKGRLATILHTMSEGVITTDRNGLVDYINDSAMQMLSCDASIRGKLIRDVGVISQDNQVVSPVLQAIEREAAVEIPPTIIQTGNDSMRLFEGTALPLRNASSVIIGGILVFRDVTEQQQIFKELQRVARLEAVGLLAGGIAHDFNNILTVLTGNIEMAGDEGDPTFRKECLDQAQTAVTRARLLTQQLLTFSKGGDPVMALTNIADIVTEVTNFSLHGAKVRCEFKFAPRLWAIQADKGQIGQVVQNLVLNAAQAMPDGGTVTIAIENQVIHGGPHVVITVSDTGQGISENDLPHLFEPYFTTKKIGHGLGLATAYSIIKKHRGQIQVSSHVGVGTTFIIHLPAILDVVAASGKERELAFRLLHGRVLVLDDDAPIRTMAELMFGQFGLEVECVAHGRIAKALRPQAGFRNIRGVAAFGFVVERNAQ